MIKGLYFKLNMDNPSNKDIYYFFEHECAKTNKTKIEILEEMVNDYHIKYYELSDYIGDIEK